MFHVFLLVGVIVIFYNILRHELTLILIAFFSFGVILIFVLFLLSFLFGGVGVLIIIVLQILLCVYIQVLISIEQ